MAWRWRKGIDRVNSLTDVFRRIRRVALRLFRPVELRFSTPRKLVLGDVNRRFRVRGWRTADIANADYVINLREGRLPWDSDSLELLYTSHLIEHLPSGAADGLFQEIYRVLKPGGVARFVCPDLAKLRDAYERQDLEFFLQPAVEEYLRAYIRIGEFPEDALLLHNNLLRTHASYGDTGEGPYAPPEQVAEKYAALDRYRFAEWCVSLLDPERLQPDRPWGHVNAWDYPKLRGVLLQAGFASVRESSFGASRVPELRDPRFDLARHKWISLYVEAQK